MNAVMTGAAADDALTMSQRTILRAAVRGGQLQRSKAGGVTALDSKGLHIGPRYPLRTVNALENNGLIVRESSPDDGRKVLITLTDRARALVAETQRRRVAWFSRQLASLSAAERGALDAAAPILRTLADS